MFVIFPNTFFSKAWFWDKTSNRGYDECWEWQGEFDHKGYGRWKTTKAPRSSILSHRTAFFLEVAYTDLCVLHRCNNSKCCNPHHLYAGTRARNNWQKKEDGRSCFGEKNPNSTLLPEQVLEIRRLWDLSIAEGRTLEKRALGRARGITGQMVGKIVYRENWEHI